jgi:adenylate cyclase
MEPQKDLFRRHLIVSILFSLFFIFLTLLFTRVGFLERADLFLYDLHFRWRGPLPVSNRILLVFMDQKSATELKREKGSWSRHDMAKAIDHLSGAGAEVIGLDMVFFAPSHNREEDLALAEAIENAGNVILAKFVAVEDRGEVTPLSMFQEGMIGDGFINMFPDRDGVLRKAPFLSVKPVQGGLAVSPGFPLEVVRAFLDLDFVLDFKRKDTFAMGREGPGRLLLPYPDLRIFYYGGEEVFQSLSYGDVVLNRFRPEGIRGKIVLIGSSLATDKDFFVTPFSGDMERRRAYEDRFGKVLEEDFGPKSPGVACHAHAVETILNGDFIGRCPPGCVHLLTVVFGCLGLIFYFHRPGALWGVLILFFCAAGITGVSHLLFTGRRLWLEISPVLLVLSLQYIGGTVLQRVYSRKKTKLVSGLFGKYVSPRVVDDILRGDIGMNLEGSSREVTVFFSDLRGFTSISEGLSPLETGRLLNRYFDAMIPVVFEHEGTLDKLMGDAVMAFFGAPGEVEDHPRKAAETALDMIRRLDALKREGSEKGIERLAVGIGLNTGPVTVGNLGSQHFMDYTVIGDTVNLGSRLEGLNKTYGTSIILGESTAARLDEGFVLRELDRVRVKGKGDAVTIFELLGYRSDLDRKRREVLKVFHEGLLQYRTRAWEEAEMTFRRALSMIPADGPSLLYLERVNSLLREPLTCEWDPVTVFTTK